MHSYAAQHAIASAITSVRVEDGIKWVCRADESRSQLFAAKAQSTDLAGLADLCDTLAENKDAMSVVFLHVEPRELLRPVRQVLDSFDTTQENSGASPSHTTSVSS